MFIDAFLEFPFCLTNILFRAFVTGNYVNEVTGVTCDVTNYIVFMASCGTSYSVSFRNVGALITVTTTFCVACGISVTGLFGETSFYKNFL